MTEKEKEKIIKLFHNTENNTEEVIASTLKFRKSQVNSVLSEYFNKKTKSVQQKCLNANTLPAA